MSDDGYLYDPDSEWSHIYNKDVVAFDNLSDIPCLILLGEPGIGKTIAMHHEKQIIDEKVQKEGNKTFWLDLSSYGNEQRLVEKLLKSSDIEKWKNSDYILYIFLDSLDECLLRIDTLAVLLVEELKDLPIERLKLRIACRTAEWPSSLESGLLSLWKKKDVRAYELTFLRQKDVIESAKANGIDPAVFLKEINNKEVVPLAIKPVTLNFLLNIFKKTENFPDTKNELYLQGCVLLCEEPSESRRDVGRPSPLNSKELLAVASRIAAVTIFGNKFAVWTSIDSGDVPFEDITINELLGNYESADGDNFRVDKVSVNETLKTGLFTSRGLHRMGWAHQTYAEFLAAHYLISHNLSIENIKSLVFHSGDPENKLIPQLYEVCSWLSSMSADLFNEIVTTNPEVLLRSDLRTSDAGYKEKLVGKLLNAFEKEEIYDVSGNLSNSYEKLFFSGLSKNLHPYVTDIDRNNYSRSAAIKIAEACDLKDLQDDVLSIVFDTEQNYHLRTLATFFIAQVGSLPTKNKLKPLIGPHNAEDIDDELKGYALDALWPDSISAKELFDSLSPPKRDNFIGSYHNFITWNLLKHLKMDDLPTALRWVEKQGEQSSLNYAIKKLEQSIMHKAWEELDSPGILEPFARGVLSRLKYHDDFNYQIQHNKISFREEITNNDNKRRLVLENIINIFPDLKMAGRFLLSHFNPFLLTKDIFWLIKRIKSTDSDETQSVLASLIEFSFDIRDVRQINAILKCCKSNSILAERLKELIEPVALNSLKAEALKNRHSKIRSMEIKDEDEVMLDPPPKVRIEELLKECESRKIDSWWRLNMEMTLREDSRFYGDDDEYDLTKLPGWENADEKTKTRIIKAAKDYILTQDCKKSEWLDKKVIYRPAVAGYRALQLLLMYDSDFIYSLAENVWEKWAAIILECSPNTKSDDDNSNSKLLVLAYQHSHAEIISVLKAIIEKENRERNHIFVISKIKILWDERIEDALSFLLESGKLKPEPFAILLRELLEHDVSDARKMAESVVSAYPSGNKELAQKAAKELVRNATFSDWEIIWPVIKKYPEFGKAVIEGYSYLNRRSHGILGLLTEEQLSELFIWLVQQYQYTREDRDSGARWLSARDFAADFKNSVLNQLTSMGTFKACEKIRIIIKHFPDMGWLNYNLVQAFENARRKTWEPPAPIDIIKLINVPVNKMVQNGDQLLDVLIESLKRLETELQGETPAAIDLWNKVQGKYTPKDEGAFSNLVKRYLKRDIADRGIIVNREVEIRRGEGEGKGERTDIHVNALAKREAGESFKTITVIIEAKGCWHKKLYTDIHDQLLGRYLRDNPGTNGLYLIGWFNCEQWDDEDYRKSDAPKMTIAEARSKFNKQAGDLSSEVKKIKAFVIDC